ncbi:MAG: acyltransferase [Lachnospiraceae bacterium]|nr:acyltransferase [Lachnospiraceae bacterium]MBQ8947881.1 acyltransferase [Lachnospiraceae bacterium]
MNKKFYNSLQILRVLAMTGIYLFHQGLADELFSRWGVCVFFVLSGFLSIYSRYDRVQPVSVIDCIRSGLMRIRHIFPLHVVMLLAAFVMQIAGRTGNLIPGSPDIGIQTCIKFLLNLFLLSDWIPHTDLLRGINGEYNIVTWFLSATLLFYMITPPVIDIMRRIYSDKNHARPVIVVLSILAFTITINLCFIYLMGEVGSFWYIYESPLSRIGDYLIGAQLGYICLSKRATGTGNGYKPAMHIVIPAAAIILNIVFICIGLTPQFYKYKYLVSSGFYFTIPVCMLIMAAVWMESEDHCRAEKPQPMALRGVYLLGDLSSYIFLIHYPVITGIHGVLKRLGTDNIALWSMASVVLTLVLTVLWDMLFKKICEG